MSEKKTNLDKLEEITLRLTGEPIRLQTLSGLKIMDTPPEKIYDDITEMLADTLDVPIALVSLVDETRQWFKSNYGLGVNETSKDVAFCRHVIEAGKSEVLVVEDATKDNRFKENPLVTSDPNIKFYAGCPIVVDGQILGTLCAIDRKPRKLTEDDLHVLQLLTNMVVLNLYIRKKIINIKESKNGTK